MALGTAAVLAIYATGYLRTRASAQRFADRDAARRPATPGAERGAARADTVTVSRGVPVVVSLPVRTIKPKVPRASAGKKLGAAVVTMAQPVAPARDSSTPVKQSAAPTSPAPNAAEVVTPGVPAAPPAPVVPVSSPAITAAATPAVDTAAHPADSVRAHFKDGTYYGWGRSRHGDIQAAVDIKDGRILSAYITQCLTRYSCSRIAAIIPQVAVRQSAEVDWVSGATESSDAFYYAIVEALSKSK